MEVRRLVREKNPFVLCIQESKLSVVDDVLIKSIWEDAPSDYSYQPSVGASGGLVTVWDSSRIDVWFCMSFGHMMVINGKVILTAEEFVIINVYAPCDAVSKTTLWEKLVQLIINNNYVCLCVYMGTSTPSKTFMRRKGEKQCSDKWKRMFLINS